MQSPAATPAFAAQMADTKRRQAAAYLDLAEACEAESAIWQGLVATPAPVPAPEPEPSARTGLTEAERVARLQSVEALTRPGEFVVYSDLGLAALDGTKTYTARGAGIAAGRVLSTHTGWTAPWRVLRMAGKDRYRVSPDWHDHLGHDHEWAQAQLEAEGVEFVNGTTGGTRRVSLSTLAKRYGDRHGA